jgi:hypothetical protein
MKNDNPAIVVVAYNRPNSLKRLLESLSKAIYPNDVTLLISLDKSDKCDVEDVANNFNWKFGDKEVLVQPKNLGLRKHILQCGDLTSRFASIILLEDDLLVSPQFYSYTLQSLSFYRNDDKVSGISLYTHKTNVNCGYRFEPVNDKYDVFWLQFASSWGQIWTKKQWESFRIWYAKEVEITENDSIPDFVISWPETSWLKYFIKFLVDTDTYFIYPRESYTTNFSDVGTNVEFPEYQYQVGLVLQDKQLHFSEYVESLSRYDVFFELKSEIIKKYNQNLKDFDFDVDLYGTKKLAKISSEYLVSNKNPKSSALYYYERNIWPHESNILFSSNTLIGEIAFSKLTNFKESESPLSRMSSLDYYKGIITIKEILITLKKRVIRIIKQF